MWYASLVYRWFTPYYNLELVAVRRAVELAVRGPDMRIPLEVPDAYEVQLGIMPSYGGVRSELLVLHLIMSCPCSSQGMRVVTVHAETRQWQMRLPSESRC